jgi:hypothetical protein
MSATPQAATTIEVQSPAASPSHPSHWQAILAAVLAIFNATEPLIIHLVPPAAQPGVETGTAIEQAVAPIIIQAVTPASSTPS